MRVEALKCGRTQVHLRRVPDGGGMPYTLCCTAAEFADLIERAKAGEFDSLAAELRQEAS